MKFFLSFLVLFFVISCSSEGSYSKKVEKDDKFPTIDLKDYRTVNFEGEFEILILKELSPSIKESDKSILGYSHFSKEKHLYIERESIAHYSNSLFARNDRTKPILETFAKEHLKDFKGILKKSSESKLQKDKVGKLDWLKSSFEGSSYGFPRTKFFTVRYFKTDTFIYCFMAWTVEESKKEFKNEALAMGMSFIEV